MFGNIAFLNEGEQAEKYKDRKAKEAAEKEKSDEERRERRYGYEDSRNYRPAGNQARVVTRFDDEGNPESYASSGKDAYDNGYRRTPDTDKAKKDSKRQSDVDSYMASKNPYHNGAYDKYDQAISKSRDASIDAKMANDNYNSFKGFKRFSKEGRDAKSERDETSVAADKARSEYETAKSEYNKSRQYYDKINSPETRDAINKHMRRHPDQWEDGKYIGPKKESSIFESVTFLNE